MCEIHGVREVGVEVDIQTGRTCDLNDFVLVRNVNMGGFHEIWGQYCGSFSIHQYWLIYIGEK